MSSLVSKEIRLKRGLQEHETLWRGEKPDLIVFATSSVRKALTFSWALHDFSFDHFDDLDISVKGPGMKGLETPAEIQAYFSEYIYNGDMALTHALQLGEFEGVPVWAHPQEGETESNENPVAESVHKIEPLRDRFEDQQVLVVSSDVVGYSSAFFDVDQVIKMGKPINYKQQREAQVVAQEELPWDSIDAFTTWYKQVVFDEGVVLGHLSGIAALNTWDSALYTAQIELIQQVTAELQAGLEVYMDAGLGGAWQQLQEMVSNTLDLLQDATHHIIPEHVFDEESELSPEEKEAVVDNFSFAHFVGVQVTAFLELLVTAQRKDFAETSFPFQQEVVVFERSRY